MFLHFKILKLRTNYMISNLLTNVVKIEKFFGSQKKEMEITFTLYLR